MKAIQPKHNILEVTRNHNPYVHIEKIGRICYKSEDLITEKSAAPFVKRLFESGHHAMIEHYRFIVEVEELVYNLLISSEHSKYLTFTNDKRCVISASARGLNDMYIKLCNDRDRHLDDSAADIICCLDDIVYTIIVDYGCPNLFHRHFTEFPAGVDTYRVHTIKYFNLLSDIEYKAHAWYSVHFICDRGVAHEMVRHRDASFAQESTRYCNYSKGKYGSEITVIKPLFWEEGSEEYRLWELACKYDEKLYKNLIKMGATAQEARSILPNSLKTEIVITAQVSEWIHIFKLRALGTTGAPHPQMREVMKPLLDEMLNKKYIRDGYLSDGCCIGG